ncbi:MAG: B12-binding domain-containing radical SAM protein [Lachnospiraceae bacterium]|nr:B12-binding domain-containing radical SAM protein [Lachnospiraceae bacterium]
MKFLLVAVNAKYIHSNPAIYSLRACVGEELRRYVELAEYTINQPMGEILADIYERKPDVTGFSCYIWNWRLVRELLTELAKLLPETDIWLGGPEVSWDAGELLRKYPQVTGVMVGEGEATFRELLETYVRHWEGSEEYGRDSSDHGEQAGRSKTGRDRVDLPGMADKRSRQQDEKWKNIPGLYLRSGATPPRACVKLDDIPFLYRDLAPFENRIIYYESSRGCPFLCSYCLSSLEKQLRFRDISVIKEELQFFLDNKVKQVKFTDRTFNCNHEHAMAVWRYLREHDNGVTNFHFEISADILREDEIELLGKMRPGLVQLEIGVQSANPQTLKAIRRVTELEKLEKIVAAIRKNRNIHQHLDLIAGLPYEDYESFGNSFNRVYHMRPEQLQLGFLKVLKGSEMWEKADEYGIIYQEQPPYEVLYTRWLTFEDVLKLKGIEEMVELYYNSGQFTHTLPFLEKAFANPFEMYEAMAEFYREKGYFKASPARGYRYQVLLDFALKHDEKREAVYRELLTYDMYLREKAKSRPAFAADLSWCREIIRDFYQEEERTRRYLPDYGEYDGRQLSKMTHLEPFVWPVWDRERMAEIYECIGRSGGGDVGTGPEFILFDYRKRNPLNHGAETCRVVWDWNPGSRVL